MVRNDIEANGSSKTDLYVFVQVQQTFFTPESFTVSSSNGPSR